MYKKKKSDLYLKGQTTYFKMGLKEHKNFKKSKYCTQFRKKVLLRTCCNFFDYFFIF